MLLTFENEKGKVIMIIKKVSCIVRRRILGGFFSCNSQALPRRRMSRRTSYPLFLQNWTREIPRVLSCTLTPVGCIAGGTRSQLLSGLGLRPCNGLLIRVAQVFPLAAGHGA